MGKENDNIYGLFGDSSNMPFKESSGIVGPGDVPGDGNGGGDGGTTIEYHNLLKGRNALKSHPADAIDWDKYNLTASVIANYINGGGGGGGDGGGKDRESSRLYLADYVTDPNDVNSVDAGIVELNSKITDGMTIDLSGDYVWPTERIFLSYTKGNIVTGGSFTRTSPNEGVEYIIWINESLNTLITGVTLDGASPGTTWGSQGIYVRRSTSTVIAGNTFKDIGDGVIRFGESSTKSDAVATTANVVISNNTFINSQQTTSNNCGAYNTVITNNVFNGSAVKITQQTQEVTGWTIIGNNTFLNTKDAPVTMQGGYNLVMHNNTIEDCGGMFKFYFNMTPLQGDTIPNKNVYITNNKLSTATGVYMIYGEVRGNKAPNSTLDVDGNIVIEGNEFHRKDGYTVTLNNSISLRAYVAGAHFGKHISICNNKFFGDHRNAISFAGNNFHTIKEGGSLTISGNSGTSIYSAIDVNAEPAVDNSGDLIIENNNFRGPQFSKITFNARVGAFRTVQIRDNKYFITKSGGIFSTQLSPFSGIKKTPIAHNLIIMRNEFHYEDDTGSGYVIQLSSPNTTDAGNFSLSMHGNLFISHEGVEITPIYVNVNSAGKAYNKVNFSNNYADLGRNTLSDNMQLPAKLITFITPETPNTYIVDSKYNSSGNGFWSLERTWSDGRHIQTGHTVLDYAAPASGNIYLGTDAPDTEYTVSITPTGSTPLLYTVKTKATGFFSPEFANAAGSQAVPEFDYTVEWYK